MQTRIAYEVLGSVATSDITNAITDAIRTYERERFWFNENRWDMSPTVDGTGNPVTDGGGNMVLNSPLFTTIPGLEFYSAATSNLIGTAVHIDKMVLVQANNRYTLTERTPQWMDDQAVGLSWRAIPTDWSYNAQEVRLYPIPDAAYPILAWGTQRFPALVNSGDQNCWTNEAELLIRSEAKRVLFDDIIRDHAEVDRMALKRDAALQALRLETARRGPPSRIRPTRF